MRVALEQHTAALLYCSKAPKRISVCVAPHTNAHCVWRRHRSARFLLVETSVPKSRRFLLSDLSFLTLLEVSRKIQSRALSPVEVTKAELDRIAALDPKLKSYATVMAESAMAQAKEAEAEIGRGEVKGPLHGVPIAVKDLCWTTNAPTAAGMTIHKDYMPSEDATVVKRLSDAGAIILGKLQLTESAYADHHPNITPPRNPWNAVAWPGASSSGSGVATAAGLCYGSLGSDTGGSIRFPSAANGVTGLKPTWGRVSRYGVFELAASLDHIGPMARSAADCGAILSVIAGEDSKDTTTLPGAASGLPCGRQRRHSRACGSAMIRCGPKPR